MRTIVRWSVSAATILLFALPAIAQVQYRLEFYGGVTIPKDKDFEIGFPQFPVFVHDISDLGVTLPSGRLVGNLDPVRGSYTHDFSPGGHGGIRIGVDSKGHFGQDIDYSYGTYASKIVNRASGESLFSFTPRVHQISWNALWYPGGAQSEGKVFPYLTLGVGGTVNSLSQRTANQTFPLSLEESSQRHLRTDNTFTFNAGFGARFRLNKRYGIRVDVRDYMSRSLRYGFPKVPGEPLPAILQVDPTTGELLRVLREGTPFESPLPIGGLFHRITASVGFVYYF